MATKKKPGSGGGGGNSGGGGGKPKPGSGGGGGGGGGSSTTPKPQPKPTQKPAPGYQWVQHPNGSWFQSGGWTAAELGPAPEGMQWVSTPGGGAALQPVQTTGGPGQPPYPAPEGFMWELAPDGKTWVLKAVPPAEEAQPEKPVEPGKTAEAKQGAKQRLKQLLESYGLAELVDVVNGLVEEWGGNNDSIILSYLRENDKYKKRFKGNEDRIKNGYGALSEAEYIGVETSIRAKMRDFGLDSAFYTNERIAGLIGGDVSSDEVTDRLTKAKRIVDSADTNIKNSLVSLYGASLGDLVGYVLDPKLASEGLQRKVNAGIAYGVAQGQGLNLDRSLSEQIGELTYGDERTARQTLGQAGELAKSVRRLQTMETDISLSDADVVEQQFGLDAEAGRKVKTLQSRERARFTGASGAFTGTLNSSSSY